MKTLKVKSTLLSLTAILVVAVLLVSCEQENLLDNANNPSSTIEDNLLEVINDEISLQIVDMNYFNIVEKTYQQTEESSLTPIFPVFHNDLNRVEKFKSQEDFELAATLVKMNAELSDGQIPVHEKLKGIDFNFATPELATFFNHEGKLIVGNTLYEIISDTEQLETNLITRETIKSLIIDFEDSENKDDPIYDYKTISFEFFNPATGSSGYLAEADYYIPITNLESRPWVVVGSLKTIEVECMQRIWKHWGARKGRAETNIRRFWDDHDIEYEVDSWTEGTFCDNTNFLFKFKSEVYNPRDDGSGEGCTASQANCKRKKNTGVTSRHYVYKGNLLDDEAVEVMNFEMD